MLIVRRIGAVALLAAAIAVWFLMEPEAPAVPVAQTQEQVRDRSSEIRQALSNYESTERAPQARHSRRSSTGGSPRTF